MKIEKNNIARLKELAKLACLTVLLGACQNDASYSLPGDPVLIKLNVSDGTSASPVENRNNAEIINSISILQFNASGEGRFDYGNLARVSPGQPGAPGTYTASLFQSLTPQDKYKLVILANLPSDISLQSLVGKGYDEVWQACIGAASADPLAFTSSNPFPMFGLVGGGKSLEIKNVNPSDVASETDYRNIELLRAVARVDIGVGTKAEDADTWDKAAIPFDMAEVQIWKAGQQCTCLPAPDTYSVAQAGNKITMLNPTTAPGNLTATKTYGASYITGGTYCAGLIYLPETLVWSSPSSTMYDAEHETRMAIIVGGYYKGSSTMTYYRMDFTKGNSLNDRLNVLRNNVYQFSISNVTDAGYDTADEAYRSKPQNLSFTTTAIDEWTQAPQKRPEAQEGYIMAFGGQNGSIIHNQISGWTVSVKSEFWEGQYPEGIIEHNVKVDYNTFYGEVPSNQKRSAAYPNGDIYPDIPTALSVEGAYPRLMVANDDVYDIHGDALVHWMDGQEYTAFDLCKNYAGLGYSDWRLPRFSELFLIQLNRASLEKQRGFTALSGNYWSGTEYVRFNYDPLTDATAPYALAMCLNPGETLVVLSGRKKPLYDSSGVIQNSASKYKIRCVRQDSRTSE